MWSHGFLIKPPMKKHSYIVRATIELAHYNHERERDAATEVSFAIDKIQNHLF